jgi:alpha-galactosidase
MFAGWETPDGPVGLWAALEWSGRWRMLFGTMEDWRFLFRAGTIVRDVVLAPGETVALPRVHLGVFAGGPEEATNSIRRYVAEVLAPDVEGERPHALLAYDHWFGIEQEVNEKVLLAQVERAAELGCEYFVVDAGWYGGSSERFFLGIGNWERVDEVKFPRGLEPLSEYVRAKGMRFGLWFEPERARVGSDWAREHGDWYWSLPDSPYVILNLTRRDAQDGLIAMLSHWVARLDIRWLRWDCNQAPGPFWDAVDPTGKVQFAYVHGLYRVFDELLARHPNLLIDNCAGGGQRIDFGTLRRAGTAVISDHAEDPHVCRIMQTGGARVFPGNYMNSSIYIGPDDPEEHVGPLELISRMTGSLTLCGHLANWSRRHTRRMARLLDGYRTFRHLLMKDFYALTEYPRGAQDWDVVQFIDPKTSEAVILAYRVRGDIDRLTVSPKGLRPETAYQVVDPFTSTKARTAQGKVLTEKGLRLSLAPESALVRHLMPLG